MVFRLARELSGIGHGREPSETQSDLDGVGIRSVNEKTEPFPIVSRAQCFSALNLFAAVGAPESEGVRIGSLSDSLVEISGSLYVVNRDSAAGVRKVDKNRVKHFPVLSLDRAADSSVQSARCRHRYVNSYFIGYGSQARSQKFSKRRKLTDFHGLLLRVIKFCLATIFSHASEKVSHFVAWGTPDIGAGKVGVGGFSAT